MGEILTIEEYALQEKDARCRLSNRFLRNIAPLTFQSRGFPVIVEYESELVRYIDSQHADALKYYVEHDCRNVTEEEFKKIADLTRDIYEFTKTNYHAEFTVKGACVDAVFIGRIIRAIDDAPGLRVTEIGAGSGMVGVHLLKEGYVYRCIEVTQAFYLLQNRLLSEWTSSMDELVTDDFKDSQFVHVPYWKIWDYRNKEVSTDIFMCNHALLEMTENSILFYIRMAKTWMINSRHGYFLLRSWGWPTLCKKNKAIRLFLEEGFELIYLDNIRRITIFKMSDNSDTANLDIDEVLGCEMYCNCEGEVIRNRLDSVVGTRTVKDLVEMYDQIAPNHSSPDEEFSEFVRTDEEEW